MQITPPPLTHTHPSHPHPPPSPTPTPSHPPPLTPPPHWLPSPKHTHKKMKQNKAKNKPIPKQHHHPQNTKTANTKQKKNYGDLKTWGVQCLQSISLFDSMFILSGGGRQSWLCFVIENIWKKVSFCNLFCFDMVMFVSKTILGWNVARRWWEKLKFYTPKIKNPFFVRGWRGRGGGGGGEEVEGYPPDPSFRVLLLHPTRF